MVDRDTLRENATIIMALLEDIQDIAFDDQAHNSTIPDMIIGF